MEVICGGRTINWWASSRAQGGQFHRQGRVALTADGAVSQILAHATITQGSVVYGHILRLIYVHHHTEVGCFF